MSHYGRYVGEKILYPSFLGLPWEGEVVGLDGTNNNRIYVREADGHERWAVAEWCKHIIEAGDTFVAGKVYGGGLIVCRATSRDGTVVTCKVDGATVTMRFDLDTGKRAPMDGCHPDYRIVWTAALPPEIINDRNAITDYVEERLP